MIEKIKLEKFTAFENTLELNLSPKINIIIGENGTGKTHLLKAMYSLCSIHNKTYKEDELEDILTKKLIGVFRPDNLTELSNKGDKGYSNIKIEMGKPELGTKTLEAKFYSSNSKKLTLEEKISEEYFQNKSVFIPTKEPLSFFNGFVSLYDTYNISFDETYRDICQYIGLPEVRKDKLSEKSKWAIDKIETVCGGEFIFKGETITFKAKNKSELSINLIAEGFKKLGVFARLIKTGIISLEDSGVIFIDEPETNMNPKLLNLLVTILLELSRNGQQIILATHEYVILKWFDLLSIEDDNIKFHSLYRDEYNAIAVKSTNNYLEIDPNPISSTFSELYDKDIKRALGV